MIENYLGPLLEIADTPRNSEIIFILQTDRHFQKNVSSIETYFLDVIRKEHFLDSLETVANHPNHWS